MATTISSIGTVTLTLDSEGQNPVVVTGSGGIEVTTGTAIAGNSGVSFQIANAGTAGGGSFGIDLLGGGSIGNTGFIGGTSYGVATGGRPSTVNNSGTISGGVDLTDGGTLINSALIANGSYGVVAAGQVATVFNTGLIALGINLADGGTIVNGGTIGTHGHLLGVNIDDAGTPLVSNTGTIFDGVKIRTGGTLTNTGTGLITSTTLIGAAAIVIGNTLTATPGTITNAGTIRTNGLTGTAIELVNGGTVTNTGSIAGFTAGISLDAGGVVLNSGLLGGDRVRYYNGVYTTYTTPGAYGVLSKSGNATVTNDGTIQGTTDSVLLEGSGANRVIFDPGASFGGIVAGATASGATNVLELAAGSGTLAGFGTAFTGFGSLELDAGAAWTVSGTAAVLAGTAAQRLLLEPGAAFTGTITGAGGSSDVLELSAGSGTGTLSGFGTTITGFGSITVDAGASWGIDASDILAPSGTVTPPTTLIDVTGTLTNNGTIQAGGAVYLTLEQGSVLQNNAVLGRGLRPTLLTGEAVTVGNAGTIAGGLRLLGGGTLTNAAGAVINGAALTGDGLIIGTTLMASPGTITNAGTIRTNNLQSGSAIEVVSGGTVTNSGTLAGIEAGISLDAGGVVLNSGLLGGDRVRYYNGAYITYTTPGAYGVLSVSGNATVTNDGTIQGTTDAIRLQGSGANRVIFDPGATFGGIVAGATASGATNVLELAAGSGTLAGFGTAFTGFGSLALDQAATWTVGGTFAAATTVTLSPDDTLAITTLASFDAGILDLGTSDTIHLLDVVANKASLDGTVLHLFENSTEVGTLAFANPFHLPVFSADPDSAGGTDVTLTSGSGYNVACYRSGTALLTPSGERPVETLRIGDHLVTLSGATRPIKWIGRRSYAGRFIAGNRDVLPICIRAGALADGQPSRDLQISPKHAMFLDDVLIPAELLVNGHSVVQLEDVDEVTYFHLELDSHDILIAEGAPSESFVDDDTRLMFQNAAEFATLYPDAVPTPARYCAPRVEDGEIIERIRRRLAARVTPSTPEPGALQGYLDTVSREAITGWARDAASPDAPVRLRILDSGVAIAELDADGLRPDLVEAGYGNGRHGFRLVVPGGLSPLVPHLIEVRRVADGRHLENSPRLLEATENWSATPACAPLRGRLDTATRERVSGWAFDDARPDHPVALVILDNGVPVARVLANRHRPDLAEAGIGHGRASFAIDFPGGLPPLERHVIAVRRESDGADLPNSPLVIEPAGSFDEAVEHAVAKAVDAAGPDGEAARVLSFLTAQTDRLRQVQADSDGKRTSRRPQRRLVPAGQRARALVIDSRVPDPGRDAGSQALLSHMRALQRLNYEVSFMAAGEMTASGTAALEAAGITCWGAPVYASVEEVLHRQSDCFDLVYLHRAEIATRYLALARHHAPRARILYSVADLHHVRLARQAAIEGRPDLLRASQRLRLAEHMAAWSADVVLTHSPVEAAVLRTAVPGARVHNVAWDVPVNPTKVPFAARSGVAFLGHYRHAPNCDAAHWLVTTVMPLVWQTDPAITCLLVGSDMPAPLRRLAGPGVEAVGQVADLGTHLFDRIRLTVAPLRFGAGLKGKVLESFAAGIPCVMTEVAAEGLPLSPVLRALIGRDAPTLAALICHLHANEPAHHDASGSALSLIAEHFAAKTVTADLHSAITASARVSAAAS